MFQIHQRRQQHRRRRRSQCYLLQGARDKTPENSASHRKLLFVSASVRIYVFYIVLTQGPKARCSHHRHTPASPIAKFCDQQNAIQNDCIASVVRVRMNFTDS
jgi:hypothetical protein